MCMIYVDKFIKLCQQTTRKDINKWKDNTHLWVERQYCKDNVEGRNPQNSNKNSKIICQGS